MQFIYINRDVEYQICKGVKEMRWRVKFAAMLIVTVFMVSILPGSPSDAKNPVNRKIVVFEDHIEQVKKDDVINKHRAKKIKDIKGINAMVVEVDRDEYFKDDSSVKYVEDDLVVSISGKVKDIEYSKKSKDDSAVKEQPAEVIPWGIEYVGAPVMWETTKGEGVKVAVIDTGIDIDHPDLVDNIKGGYNTIKKKGSYDDDNGHGTHVAGIIGAVDNDIGVVGVAPEVDLYAVKALDENGDGYVSDIVEAIQWCIDNDIDIVNMSLGLVRYSETLHEAVIKSHVMGLELIASAGNNYGGVSEYPAAFAKVISVGALSAQGYISDYSAVINVDYYEPGDEIYSTWLDSTYSQESGTSMAAPHYVMKIVSTRFIE